MLEDALPTLSLFDGQQTHQNGNTSSRTQFLNGIAFNLAYHSIFLYFLDWSFLCLLIRGIQLFCVYKGSSKNSNYVTQRALFISTVLFANFPVLLMHLLYKGSHPIILVFVGNQIGNTGGLFASPLSLLFHDFIVIGLQTLLILNFKFVKFGTRSEIMNEVE
mmetsp:Transcript_22665/g.31557  ORF Transcript_22665/g.31557 Transcript_22665/m.31557 type:complete len:162 (-) Transcript_22665:71-556(-)